MDDLYRILGVRPDATAEEIRERFRFLAQAFHPDKFSNIKQKQQAEEEFKLFNNAYQILSIPEKRKRYDSSIRNIYPNYSYKTSDSKIRKTEQANQRAREEKARKRAQEDIDKQENARKRAKEETPEHERQRKRSKEWIEANQAIQKGAKLQGVDLRNAYLEYANFDDADLRDANLNGVSLFYAKLVRADLTNSKLICAFLCSLNYGETLGADATMAILRGATLKCANLGNVNFTESVLENADLSETSMYNVNLTGANLKDASLMKAYITRSKLNKSNLTGANLCSAELGGSDLTEATLTGANLSGAVLDNANFTDTILENTNFKDALFNEKTIFPKNFNPIKSGMILNDIYYKDKQWKLERERSEQEKQLYLKISENSKIPNLLPPEKYHTVLSWRGFSYTNIENKIIGVSPTGYSTIELIGLENHFTEIILRFDYIHENVVYVNQYGKNIVFDLLNLKDATAACNWLLIQDGIANTSRSDFQAKKKFGNTVLSIYHKYREGVREYLFTSAFT